MNTRLQDLKGSWTASVRIQLSADFDFEKLEAIVPLLARIGIRWLYLSPIWEAAPGSTHFYDVIAADAVSQVLGSEPKFRKLAGVAGKHGMRIILDFVPNHMATDESNKMWMEQRAQLFDVEPGTGVYRRFWDFGSMAALAMNKRPVYDRIHSKLLQLFNEGLIHGVRIDHPEGLQDLYGYSRWLHESFAQLPTIYIEKAHRPGKNIPDGVNTVGMEWWWDVERLLGTVAGREQLAAFWKAQTGENRSFDEIAADRIANAAATNYRQDAERLHRMLGLSDVTVDDVVHALGHFRDRIYPDLVKREVSADDRKAIAEAKVHPSIEKVLLLQTPGHDEFVAEFASVLVGVCGRGEHIARFRYMALPARCDHGFEPHAEGISAEQFHANNQQRLAKHRHGMLAGSTHDAYRSFDARCMLDALSLFAPEWEKMVARWREINQPLHKGDAKDLALSDELSIYTALLSCPDVTAERLTAYIIKAAREGWVTSNWFRDDKLLEAPATYHRWGISRMSRYEHGIEEFITGLFDSKHGFMKEFKPFCDRVSEVGRMYSLVALVMRLTAPGMADIYNGDDLWYFRLLDPDNRDLHDWDLRRQIIDGFERGEKPTLENVKLWITWKILKLRLDFEDAFMGDDSYKPLQTGAADVMAFQRGDKVQVWVGLTPTAQLKGAGEGWTDVLSDSRSLSGLPGNTFAAVYVKA